MAALPTVRMASSEKQRKAGSLIMRVAEPSLPQEGQRGGEISLLRFSTVFEVERKKDGGRDR